MSADLNNRRPLKSRDSDWAKAAAALLARAGVSPNAVSAGAVVFAAASAAAFVGSGLSHGSVRAVLLLAAALAIQLRLICNLMDGLVAVEHGRGGPHGPIWNELPDRLADAMFLIGAGYGAALAGAPFGETLGWLAAVAAVLTAYVRELGRGLGFAADFSGPGAKPQRMAVLTGACVVSALEPLWGWRGQSIAISLGIIALLAGATVARRTALLATRLKARSDA